MAIAGGNITLDSTEGMDKISQTDKVTSPYFSDGSTTLLGASIKSSSLTDTNETYFFGISNSSTLTTEEFNVAFGSTNGYGSNDDGNDLKPPTEAIYKQYAGLLLAPTEVTGGFKISQGGSHSKALSGKDEEIYVLTARRSNMKDRLNKGTWQINLSGSNSAGAFGTTVGPNGNTLHLKDDSSTTSPTATPVGDRYNIVSCSSAGVIAGAATVQNFGDHAGICRHGHRRRRRERRRGQAQPNSAPAWGSLSRREWGRPDEGCNGPLQAGCLGGT